MEPELKEQYIFNVKVNDKYEFKVLAIDHKGAEKLGREFYLKNNFFTDRKIESISTKGDIKLGEVVNIDLLSYKNPPKKSEEIEQVDEVANIFARMREIKSYLLNILDQGVNPLVKERIDILLREEVTTYCKCSECGHKFDPQDDENYKSGITMYPES